MTAADDRRSRPPPEPATQARSEGPEPIRIARPAAPEAAGRATTFQDLGSARGLTSDDPATELARLEQAVKRERANPSLWFSLAGVLRKLDRAEEEMTALETVLAIQPGNLQALLQVASLHEVRGDSRTAAAAYRAALRSIRPGAPIPAVLRPMLDHGAATIAANDRALEIFLEQQLGKVRERHKDEPLGRFDKSLATLLRKRRVYRPTPTFLYFPYLPALEFYDHEDFPWLASIEAETDAIRGELMSVLADGPETLRPYVTTEKTPGVTTQKPAADEWRELSESPRWGVYFFWQEGVAYPEHIARCPRTAAALEACPRCDLPRTAPTAMFSVLDAKTRIPPHSGVTNARLIVHLPLIVPDNCGFRVGAETREWRPGTALVFDDSIEHEAWNQGDQARAVLIFDIWNPFLTLAERDLVRTLNAGVGEYYGSLPTYV